MIQFTIRDLMLGTVIAALCLGWAGDRHEKAARIERLEVEVAHFRAIIKRGYQRGGRPDGIPLNTDY